MIEDMSGSQSFPTTVQRRSSTLYPTRLSEDSIRLLTVLPSSGFNAPIECELRQHKVSDEPDSEGLSYVWGDPTNVTAMTCSGVNVHITINLHNALKRVRDAEEPKTIWADALCLNQADAEEKNNQVPLMGQVFMLATNTVIYLGYSSDEEATMTEYGLNAIFEMIETLRIQAGLSDDDHSVEYVEVMAHGVRTQPLPDVSWDCIGTFFDTEWFERIWCVQEIALARDAKRSSYAIYGRVRLQFARLNEIGMFLWIATRLGVTLGTRLSIPSRITSILLLHYIREQDNYLLKYLEALRGHRATDPRDKVYGLLGILRQHEDFDFASVSVDYAKSLAEVYTDVAVEIVRRGADLTILDHTSHSVANDYGPNYPSWVPRWDRAAVACSLPLTDQDCFQMRCPYSLTTQHGRSNRCSAEEGSLLAYRIKYNKVTVVSSLLDAELIATVSQYWDETMRVQSAYCENPEKSLLMARTLSTGYAIKFESFSEVTEVQENQTLADFLDFLHGLVQNMFTQLPWCTRRFCPSNDHRWHDLRWIARSIRTSLRSRSCRPSAVPIAEREDWSWP